MYVCVCVCVWGGGEGGEGGRVFTGFINLDDIENWPPQRVLKTADILRVGSLSKRIGH